MKSAEADDIRKPASRIGILSPSHYMAGDKELCVGDVTEGAPARITGQGQGADSILANPAARESNFEGRLDLAEAEEPASDRGIKLRLREFGKLNVNRTGGHSIDALSKEFDEAFIPKVLEDSA